MKLLLLGAGGRLGRALARTLAPLGDLRAATRRTEPRADLLQPQALVDWLGAWRPDVVVNAAAWTAVDAAEAQPALVHRVNAEAPGRLAEWAATRGALLVHYSSDHVFAGAGDAPQDEEAPTGPLNVYGRSKLEGERRVQASGCRHLILRTSRLHAPEGDSFTRTMLALATARDRLDVVDDQVGAPTPAALVAEVTAQAIVQTLAQPALAGLYHCTARGATSWFGHARFAIEWARARGLPLRVAPEAVHAVPSAAYPTPAARPLNSRLDVRRLEHRFGLRMPHWRPGLERQLEALLLPPGGGPARLPDPGEPACD